MCGITGQVVLDTGAGRRADPAMVERMRQTMVHRGPDDAGLWSDASGLAAFGFRRLAIQDLSAAANQPMTSACGRFTLVFNGEIYNHAEVRALLDRDGRAPSGGWRTDHADSETLLQAWAVWGERALPRLRGMFAFAVWDAGVRTVTLVRDRIGVKPIYYAEHAGMLRFASEIKAILADPGVPRRVDEESLFQYLSFLTAPAPGTMFEGIRKLPGGCLLTAGPGARVSTRRWYDLHAADVGALLGEAPSADGCARLVLATLREAVKDRKVSDVPVGVFLSGGVDSSVNAALFSEGEPRPVETFCVAYEGEHRTYRNESHHARAMAERLGAAFHERRLTVDDLLGFLDRMIDLQDEPIADPVCFPVYFVSELARRHGVVVAHAGEGADELFFGYPAWARARNLQALDRLPVPRSAKALGVRALRAAGRGAGMAAECLRRGAAGVPVFWSGAESFGDALKKSVLAEPLRRRFAGETSWSAVEPIRRDFEASGVPRGDTAWMAYADLRLRLPELLLMRLDKMSMGVGLEARVPFLDHRLVELALGIPEPIKLGAPDRRGELKSVLKRAVRGLVPDDVIDRPKQGFGVPVHEWFRTRLGARMTEAVRTFADDAGLLDRGAVDALLADPRRAPQAWVLTNVALWHRRAIAGSRAGL